MQYKPGDGVEGNLQFRWGQYADQDPYLGWGFQTKIGCRFWQIKKIRQVSLFVPFWSICHLLNPYNMSSAHKVCMQTSKRCLVFPLGLARNKQMGWRSSSVDNVTADEVRPVHTVLVIVSSWIVLISHKLLGSFFRYSLYGDTGETSFLWLIVPVAKQVCYLFVCRLDPPTDTAACLVRRKLVLHGDSWMFFLCMKLPLVQLGTFVDDKPSVVTPVIINKSP